MHNTPKISGDDKDFPENESSATTPTIISRRRAYDKNQKVSLDDDDSESNESIEEIEPPKSKSINKKIIESDGSHDLSSILGLRSPIEI
ncbi:hypothetical protein AYI69_g9053 [Smittium culicis]|uniref:Uncharacterized protein n=1 Tax=Smittium culicis TaxID=133412 RepID=A0A1R1XFD5_9FUNG|nr:hypothetical protein AYI69_g9053 [Smittium culicis]